MKRSGSLSLVLLFLFAAASGAIFAGAAAVAHPNDGVAAPYLLPESRLAPEYPPAAYDARMEGYVTLAALVTRDGTVSGVDVLDCSAPNVGFEAAAAAAVERWRFEPGSKDGDAIDAFSVVRLTFRRATGPAESGSVTAAFVPIGMLRASIVAGATDLARAAGSTSADVNLAGVESDVHPHLAGRLTDPLFDQKAPWVPERELTLDTSKMQQPPIHTDK